MCKNSMKEAPAYGLVLLWLKGGEVELYLYKWQHREQPTYLDSFKELATETREGCKTLPMAGIDWIFTGFDDGDAGEVTCPVHRHERPVFSDGLVGTVLQPGRSITFKTLMDGLPTAIARLACSHWQVGSSDLHSYLLY